ncbi:MAG TPA: type IV secretory system conjugative DNA transfer family protein [Solirubrobacterales bacterium]|nr:type IV secretory system conjugative DNA transfer family protein [Solirubrobacterales bacterium]
MSPERGGVYWALAALAGALLGLIWLTGALSGAFFGAGWTPIPASELLITALRLPSHLGEPRAAWPRGSRSALPGAVGFYLSAALILAVFIGLALALRRAAELIGVPHLRSDRRRPPSARWASGRELRALRVPFPQPGRLTVGRAGRSLLAAQERQSVIVVAPSQSGKTSGLAIPALLEWQGPALATSTKSDLLGDTVARREQLGEVMIFDPARVSGMEPSRATPLQGCTSWRGAMRVAHWLTAAARTGNGGGLGDADFWYSTAEKLLAPLLFAAATSGRTMAAVIGWLDEGPEASAVEVETLLGEAGEPAAKRAWQATQNREERQRSSVYTTAEIAVAAFSDPRVIEETAGADYTPAALLDGGMNTLYMCAPSHEQERLRTLFSTMVQELVAVAYESAAATGKPIDPPLLLVLDEAANIAPIPNLDEIASSGAGQGVQLLSVFQDLAQIRARYGERASTIVNNHRAKVFGTGISDPETLNYVSRVVGAGEFEQLSRTAGEQGRRTMTEGDTYRDLAPANVVREADPGSGILVYGHLPPAKIRLRTWFEERALNELRQASAGTSRAWEM